MLARFFELFSKRIAFRFVHALILLLFAAPAFAQVDVVAKYRAQYGTPLSADQKVSLLRSIASELHGGLLRKPDGTNCGGYSCDVICFSDVTLFDVLADQDNAAIPTWSPTTNPRGYRCELAPATQTGPVPTVLPTPAPQPTTPQTQPVSLDLAPIFARLDAIVAQNERIYADLTNQHHDQTTQILAAVNEPAFIKKLVSNPIFQVALSSVVTGLVTHQVMK